MPCARTKRLSCPLRLNESGFEGDVCVSRKLTDQHQGVNPPIATKNWAHRKPHGLSLGEGRGLPPAAHLNWAACSPHSLGVRRETSYSLEGTSWRSLAVTRRAMTLHWLVAARRGRRNVSASSVGSSIPKLLGRRSQRRSIRRLHDNSSSTRPKRNSRRSRSALRQRRDDAESSGDE
jgi:hypothetical protein